MKLVLRTTMAWLAVGLAICAFRLARLPLPPYALAPVFCIFCSTRLQNDWRDRHHDLKKGRKFVSARPRLFLGCLLGSWAVCGALVAIVAIRNPLLALLLLAMVLAGLVYSETRRMPWVPISISAITSASPAFLPSTFQPDLRGTLPLFAVALLFIFGREVLKDIEDQKIDVGYKWTIPVAYGDRAAKWLAIVSVAAGCAVAASISPLTIAGCLVAGTGLVLFGRNSSPAATMSWLDAGAMLVIAALLLGPFLPYPA